MVALPVEVIEDDYLPETWEEEGSLSLMAALFDQVHADLAHGIAIHAYPVAGRRSVREGGARRTVTRYDMLGVDAYHFLYSEAFTHWLYVAFKKLDPDETRFAILDASWPRGQPQPPYPEPDETLNAYRARVRALYLEKNDG